MVEQNGIQLPTYNASSMPNFPNYRLGGIPPVVPSFVHQVFGDSVLFQSTSTGGEVFEWGFGDGGTASGAEVWHEYAQPGSYPVTLTVSHDCLSEVAVDTVVVVFTGAGERHREGAFSVYPNPAQNELHLAFEARGTKGMLLVTDATGKVLKSLELSGETRLLMDVSPFPNGIYSCQVLSRDSTQFQRFVIAR